MMNEVCASVVIVTLNRAEAICLLLEELTWQKNNGFEVVIVVGPVEDNTIEMLEPLTSYVKLVRCDEANVSKARNLGVAAASGDVIVFIDDDAYPGDVNWLSRYLEFFAHDEHRNGIVGGEVLIRDDSWFEFRNGMFNRQGFQVFDSEAMKASGRPGWIPRVAGGNNACMRDLYRRMRGYDERISYYLDETDFCCRLHDGEHPIYQISNPVRHYRYPSAVRSHQKITDWFPIAQSDFYFAVQNSNNPKIIAILCSWILLGNKHYFRDAVFGEKGVGFLQRLAAFMRIVMGGIRGTCLGFQKRKLQSIARSDSKILTFDHDAVRRVAKKHFYFRNNPMGEGSFSFRSGVATRQLFQIYWDFDERDFVENRSVHTWYPEDRKCRLEFKLALPHRIRRVRIDPIGKPGYIEDFELKIFDQAGESIVEWNSAGSELILETKDLVGLKSAMDEKVRFECRTDDPWFILQLPSHSSTEYRFVVSFRMRAIHMGGVG